MTELILGTFPIKGTISGGFGDIYVNAQGVSYTHRGLDIAAPEGEPIYSACPGTSVVFTNNGDFGPNAVCIREPESGLYILYAHGRKSFISVNDTVEEGQLIAEVGHEGLAFGNHLHLQVCIDSRFSTNIADSFDPLKFFPTEADLQTIEDLKAKVARLELLMGGNGVPPEGCNPDGTPKGTLLKGEDALVWMNREGFSMEYGLSIQGAQLRDVRQKMGLPL